MYDPSTGRFINEDPIRDGLNWYVYCENNPVMFVDPWGLKAKGEIIYQGANNNELDVKIIQLRLNDLGYVGRDGNKLLIDGIYGTNTRFAVEKYQKDNNLSVDGIVGDNTWINMGIMLNTDVTEKLYDTVLDSIVTHHERMSIDYTSNQITELLFFYTLVSNKSPLDLKQKKEWQSEYFIFDGNVYRSDAPGNIAYGMAGELLGIKTDLLMWAAGYAQKRAGTSLDEWNKYNGDDPYDQLCIEVGRTYVVKKKK